MNKKGFITITIILITLILAGGGYYFLYYKTDLTSAIEIKQEIPVKTIPEDKPEDKKEPPKIDLAKDRINKLRKKLELKGLILKGDIHLQNKEYTIALSKYLQISKELPNDESIIKKIGDSYFSMKKFDMAYKYYKKVKDYKYLDKRSLINSLIYSTPLTKENIVILTSELKTLDLNEEEMFYYTNSFLCIENFELCKNNFITYFDKNKEKDKENEKKKEKNKDKTENKELSTPEINSFVSDDLKNINFALENYKNFNMDDVLYQNALLNGAFFENGLYPIVINTSLKILKEKPDYRSIIKIIAKSYFEIGDYVDAKKFLMNFYELGEEDAEISFFLGIIYEKNRDYVLSSLHLKKAITLGYKGSLNAKKRLIYNYHELGEIDDMLKTFKDIIENHTDSITNEDLSLAIFYNILNEKISDAESFTKLAIKKFPTDEIFYGYMAWINIQNTDPKSLKLAEENIKKGFEIKHNNPMLNLIAGKIEEQKGNKSMAVSYYKRAISLDENGEFGKLAKESLDKLN